MTEGQFISLIITLVIAPHLNQTSAIAMAAAVLSYRLMRMYL